MPYKDREKQLEYLRKYNKSYQKKRYACEKDELIKKLGGRCSVCGSDENLEFDHIVREGKKFAITAKLHSKDLEAELMKCQLLCHDCHKKKHFPKSCRGKLTGKLPDSKSGESRFES